MVRSSSVPRKDFARCRISSWRLALQASLEMWLSQERSCQLFAFRNHSQPCMFITEAKRMSYYRNNAHQLFSLTLEYAIRIVIHTYTTPITAPLPMYLSSFGSFIYPSEPQLHPTHQCLFHRWTYEWWGAAQIFTDKIMNGERTIIIDPHLLTTCHLKGLMKFACSCC